MGMRQNIELKYDGGTKIYFYSHWDGGNGMSPLKKKLRAALARKERWDDESYLARIIFEEIVKRDIGSETGYGIAPYVVDDEYPTIEVDLEKQTVDGVPFQKFIGQAKVETK